MEKTTTGRQAAINRTMGATEWILIIILSILWGGSFFFVGVAVQALPPLTIVSARVLLAALILLGFLVVKGEQIPMDAGLWGAFFIMGALNNLIPFCLIVWGQTQIESGLASILNATTPIFSVVLAHYLAGDEKLTSNRLIGVLIGWVGVTVMMGIKTAQGVGLEVLGQIAVLGAALSYACAAIYGRRFKGYNPLVVAAGMLAASAIMILPLALVMDQPWRFSPEPSVLLALFGLAALSTALAYLIYFRVLATAGATNLLLVTFLIPVSAIALGALVLGERLGWADYAGMAIIFTGLITIDGRLLRSLKG